MAKTSRTSRIKTGPSTKRFDHNDANIGQLNTWKDVADVEDEFHMNRDEVSLEESSLSGRPRQHERDVFDEPSDEEVLGLEDLPSSDEDDYDQDNEINATDPGLSLDNDEDDDDDDESRDQSDDPDVGGWGTSKRDYYDADDIEDETDAKEEEAEARRLQAKQLAAIDEADYIFDENDWKETDVLPIEEEEITFSKVDQNASSEEKQKFLHIIHPEFDYLANEFLDLELELEILSKRASKIKSDGSSIVKTKFTVLSAYMSVLSMYFALLTRERPEGEMSNVKEHNIMDSLLKCRQTWQKIQEMDDEESNSEEISIRSKNEGKFMNRVSKTVNGTATLTNGVADKKRRKSDEAKTLKMDRKRKRDVDPETKLAEKKRAHRLAITEAGLADLDDLLQPLITSKKLTLNGKVIPKDNDFGEETYLQVDDAEEKAKRKKSLRFYTSQIAQKSGKRGRAGRDAGGDMDIPHKEREKDRKDRLTAEAIKRGQSSEGADLDDEDFDEDDMMIGKEVRGEVAEPTGEDEEYYNLIASKSKSEKVLKKLLYDAEKGGERVVETEVIDPETGKRAIGYTIEKNKGLTPHRKKDVRNPRVKKRKKYEAAKKKLGSKKAIYKVPTGAYAGEQTGIKTRLVKSVKFK